MTGQAQYMCPGCQSTITDGDLMRCPHCYRFFGPEKRTVQPYPVTAAVPGYASGLRSVLKKLHLGKSSPADRI